LASEAAKPQLLTVSFDNDTLGEWVFSPVFLVLDRFKETARDAGGSLGAPKGIDPVDFWLDCLVFFLWRYENRHGLRVRDTGPDRWQEIIDDVIQASERFCHWLSRSASNALQLLNEKPSDRLAGKRVTSHLGGSEEQPPSGRGEAWAAKKNREQEARTLIIQALQKLGVLQNGWPDYIQAWHADTHNRPTFRSQAIPPWFQPPILDRLTQPIEEWTKLADAAWEQHRNRFVASQQSAEELGIDEKIPHAKKSRGKGKTHRNADLTDRHKWVALSLLGKSWKEIAIDDGASTDDEIQNRSSTVRKAANRILQVADWPSA
jgi:hypothetical protein